MLDVTFRSGTCGTIKMAQVNTSLGKYWLGIHCMFVTNRIAALAQMGKLIVVEDTCDCYHLFTRVFAKP